MREMQDDTILVEYGTKNNGKRFEYEGDVYEVVQIFLLVKKRKREASNEIWETGAAHRRQSPYRHAVRADR
jgi:predicted LPLAT superfamily acyltransferase